MQDMQIRSHSFVMERRPLTYRDTVIAQDCFAWSRMRVRIDPRPQAQEPAVPARLDAIDRKILKELQDDGRITNVELARRVGISAPPCLRRVRALAQAGPINGDRARLGEKIPGYEVTVFPLGDLSGPTGAGLKASEGFA